MRTRNPGRNPGFTLIELLVVITIMGIVAALIVTAGAAAMRAKRNAAVNADKNKLMTLIDRYQSKLNFYPPDNGNLATTNALNYDATAAKNPLLYELTGGTNNTANGTLTVFFGNAIPATAFVSVFNRASLANADTSEPQDFFIPGPQPQEYTNYPGSTVYGLVVAVPLTNGQPNFWHYDSSSTNRHNQNGYDLWAEYNAGTTKNGAPLIMTSGNW